MSTTYNVWCKQCQDESPWAWNDMNLDTATALAILAPDILALDRKANTLANGTLRRFYGVEVHIDHKRSALATEWLYQHEGHEFEVRDEYGQTKEEW